MLQYASHRQGTRRLATLLLLFFTLSAPKTAALDPWSSYNQALERRPYLTSSLTAATLMSISDVGCQKFETNEEQKRSLDLKRTLHVAITGFFWSAPFAHTWYTGLEKLMPPIDSKALGVFIRLMLETFLWSPASVGGYLTCRTLLEGSNVLDKLRLKYKEALLAAWTFWPGVSIINYGLVPLQHRVLYVNCLSVVWNAYLTHLNAGAAKTLERNKKE